VGSGIELALQVAALLPNKPKVQVFKNYGTAMLRYEDTEIEFVGARKVLSFESRILWLKTDRFRIKIVVILL
jgi:tRNA nucleotidyltransferase (CCA-adding enzyme)